MKKRRITWVTPDCFIDVDYNSGVIEEILKHFDIYAIIILTRNSRFKESDFDAIKRRHSNLNLRFVYFEHRARDLRTLADYYKIYRMIMALKADVNYINVVPENPLSLPLFMLPKLRTIYTAHDGYVKDSFKLSKISKISFEICYNRVKYVNLFSPKQEEIFNHHFQGKDTFVIPLGLKDFGEPTQGLRTDKVSFLSFGTFHEDKNIGLLIKAGEQLYNEGERGFVISINGFCTNWSDYQKLIRHPKIFELDIRSLDNSEIANLFARNHYAVFPYKQSGQSGVLKVAMRYNCPVIVSNLEGFTFDISNGYNGFVFSNGDVEELKNVMRRCIHFSTDEYLTLQNNIKEYVASHYSLNKIGRLYTLMFDKVLNCK